jgi:hypothetical protein
MLLKLTLKLCLVSPELFLECSILINFFLYFRNFFDCGIFSCFATFYRVFENADTDTVQMSFSFQCHGTDT